MNTLKKKIVVNDIQFIFATHSHEYIKKKIFVVNDIQFNHIRAWREIFFFFFFLMIFKIYPPI